MKFSEQHPLSLPAARFSSLRTGIIATVMALSTAGCEQDLADSSALLAEQDQTADKGAIIVGEVDWQESATLPAGTAERVNSDAVAYLSLGPRGRCTGFLIAPDVLMTNQHCVADATEARGLRAIFGFEAGATERVEVDCSTFLGADATHDFALLRCADAPGDVFGVLELADETVGVGEPIYVIHQNCDSARQPGCSPTKKYSPGTITASQTELSHSADTLGGSSGSPMFSRTSHKVVGLHHVGVGGDREGRGIENRAVKMQIIKQLIAERHPSVVMGGRAPAEDVGELPQQGDSYEPNDTPNGAVSVALPFSFADGFVEANDRDHFSFVASGTGAYRITLSFENAVGDLDLYLLDATGRSVASSTSVSDTESVVVNLPRERYTAVIAGYQGATGGYSVVITQQ